MLFEKVNNGFLSAGWYSNSVEHLKLIFFQPHGIFAAGGAFVPTQEKKKLIFFYKNSGRAVPMNFFHKKIYLIFLLRGSEFDSDPKHSDKEYIYLIMDILHMIYCVIKALCCKYIVL